MIVGELDYQAIIHLLFHRVEWSWSGRYRRPPDAVSAFMRHAPFGITSQSTWVAGLLAIMRKKGWFCG